MSFIEDSESESAPEWKTKIVMKGEKVENSRSKYQQKFCDKWMDIFHPWLVRCDDEPDKPFCRACQCRLDCNRCHLQRHERTSKHARNLEVLVNKGENAARQNSCIRQERSKYYQQRKKLHSVKHANSDHIHSMDTTEDIIEESEVDGETSFQFVHAQPSGVEEDNEESQTSMKQELVTSCQDNPIPVRYSTKIQPIRTVHSPSSVKIVKVEKDDRSKIITQVRNEMLESFKELLSSGNISNAILSTPPKEKNHVDLFFESVSSSVQALSPKLIAETKMRVMQLICELELRALNESESNNTSNSIVHPNSTTVLVAPQSGNSSYIVTQSSASVVQDNNVQEFHTHN